MLCFCQNYPYSGFVGKSFNLSIRTSWNIYIFSTLKRGRSLNTFKFTPISTVRVCVKCICVYNRFTDWIWTLRFLRSSRMIKRLRAMPRRRGVAFVLTAVKVHDTCFCFRLLLVASCLHVRFRYDTSRPHTSMRFFEMKGSRSKLFDLHTCEKGI